MGEFTDARDFMVILFACMGVFFAQLPHGTVYDVEIIDLMQWLAGKVMSKKLHTNGFNTGAILSCIDEAVAHHQNNEEDPARPLIATALVVLLDTVHQVPKSKGATQKSRDSGDASPHIDEARYNQLRALYPEAAPNIRFIENNHQPHVYPLQGSEVWRSDMTKMQLYTLITCHLLHSYVKPDKVLIIDDGLALSTEEYERLHRRVVEEGNFTERSAFEQDCLVHNHLTSCLTRYIVYGDGRCREWPSTGTGEADIKVQHYINRSNGAHRFLVVNQDTDLIFILLLHMHRLVEGDQADEPLDLWLDTESPNNKSGVNKPYRYINIVRLYYCIKELFAREFPSVVYPIETFCFLFFTRRTDFVAPFSDGCPNKRGHDNCVCIRDQDTWDLFSELHTDPGRDFIRFTKSGTAIERVSQRYWSTELHGIISHAVSYDSVRGHFLFMHRALRRFYYLMFQRKIMTIRHTLRLPVPLSESYDFFGPIRTDAIDCDELCVYAHDVAERIEAYRRHIAAKETAQLQALATKKRPAAESIGEVVAEKKKFKHSSHYRPKVLRPVGDDDNDDDCDEDDTPTMEKECVTQVRKQGTRKSNTTEVSMERYVANNGDVLRDFAKFPFKHFHGVLSPEEMLLRLYDIELYMNYCRDGYRMGTWASQMLTERAHQDDSLSVWPYKERVISDPVERARVLNSSYYVKRYNPENENWYDVVEITKSDRVIHTRYGDM